MIYIIGLIFAMAAYACADDIGDWIADKIGA